MMRAVVFESGCEPSGLKIGQVDVPQLTEPNNVMIKVITTAINRADTLQRKGLYPPPAGESSILGLEAAGVITDISESASGGAFNIGDRVMVLLSGGGNAEFVATRLNHLIKIPDSLDFTQAAAIPEVWLTAFQLLNRIGQARTGDTVLIHAGASGVGTAAIQLVKHLHNGTVIATVGSEEKRQFVLNLGADLAINYKSEDFEAKVKEFTDGKGVNVVLDCVGESYWEKNAASCAMNARWVLYGLLSGANVNGNLLRTILSKRIRIEGTTLRGRDDQYKSCLVKDFSEQALPLFVTRTLKPIIDSVLPFGKIPEAHERMEKNLNFGKIVLQVQSENSHHVEDHSMFE